MFSGNAGSAISLTDIGLHVTRGTFTGNTGASGGAINTSGSAVTIDNSTFSRNTATGSGGAIYASGGAVTVNNGTFDGNTAATDGGAVYGDSTQLTVNYSWLVNNTATGGSGGAVYTNAGTRTIYQSLVALNQAASNAGGVYTSGGTLEVNYSTLAGNTLTGGTKRDLYMQSGTVNVRYSIVLDEYSSQNSTRPVYTATLYQSIRRINTTGNANHQLTSGEKLFVGTGDYTEYYKLIDGSAAIDGTRVTSGGPAADLAGENRPIGSAYDYGAFEYTGNRVYGLTQTYNGESQVLVGYDSTVDPDSIQYYVGGQWTSTAPECRNAGDYDLTVRYKKTGGGDYIETTVTGKITKKALSLTFTAADKDYDGTTDATASFDPATGFSGLVSGDNVVITVNSAVFGRKNAGTRNVTVNWTAGGSDAGNYTITAETLTATIRQRQLTISGTTVADKIYNGDTDADVTAGTLGNLVDGESLTVEGSGSFPSDEPGTYDVLVSYTISGTGEGNYKAPVSENITASILGPETRSMHVTTYDDVVNQYDGVISLREALVNYYGTVEAGDVPYANDGKTVTFAATLTDKDKANPITGTVEDPVTMKLNSGFTFGSSTYDGVVIDGDKRIRIGGTEESPLTFQIFRLNSARTATFDGLIFENISTSSKGSAIGTSDDTIYGVLTLKDCSFTNVASTSTGGAVYSLRDALNVTDCSFTNNTATSGSAIYATSVSQTVKVSGTTFTGNHTTGTSNSNGGAVYYAKNNNSTTTDSLTITDCTFTGNDSQKDAAAVFIGNATNATISGSTFTGNTSAGRGGAINSNCQGVSGGIVGTLTVTDSRFTGNTGVYGGAIYSNPTGANSVAVKIEDSVFDGNTATCRGGAMSFDGYGTPEVKNSRIVNNKATGTFSDTDSGCGGGIYGNRPLIVNDSWITGNTAAAHGAGIMMKSGAITVYQSLIADNTATGNGGGIYTYNSNSKLTMSWSTVAGNTAASGADFYSNSSISHDVSYSILLSRSGGNMNYTASLYTGTASSTSGHCRVYQSGDILFKDAEHGDYTLAANSVAIDGTEVSTGGPATDLNGETRPQGDYYDYGAFEYKSASAPETPSMHVTTDLDVVNEYDGLISLREALTVYYGTVESGTVPYANDGKTVTFESDLPEIKANETFTLNASHNGATIDGGGEIVFDGDVSFGTGGAVRIFKINEAANITLKGLTFQDIELDNWASSVAIMLSEDDPLKTLTIDSCRFLNNEVTGSGGVLYANGMNVTIVDSNFTGNSSEYDGGAIYFASGNSLSITGTVFKNNTALSFGGAVYTTRAGSLTLNDTVFEQNTSGSNGGAVYADSYGNDTITITDSTFTGNITDTKGGAIYVQDGAALEITRGTFDGNKVINGAGGGGGGGGAIYYASDYIDHITISDSVFTNNQVTNDDGGAIRLFGWNGEQATISGTLFRGNSATCDGGAIWTSYVDLTANYCRVVENSAGGSGGGFNLRNGSHTVYQSLIADNETSGRGGGIYADFATSVTVSWSTLANNTNKDIDLNSSSVTVSNSIALDLASSVAKTGVVITNSEASAADLFTDGTNADPKLRDYTLKAGSAAIDASGVTSGKPVTDLAGNTRAGHGSAYDCGAYEFVGASPASLPYSDAADAAFSSLDEDDLVVDFDVF